jgi:hypothetical protein
MSRTYDGEKNVLSLVVSRRLFEAMHNSVSEGRRYREMKKQIDAELDVIDQDAEPAWEEYKTAITNFKTLKKNLPYTNLPLFERERRLRDARRKLRKTQRCYRDFKTRELRLKSKLRKAESNWLASLVDIDYFHALILEHAGVVSEDKDKGWTPDEYKYHHNIRSRDYGEGDAYDGEDTDTNSTDSEPSIIVGYDERSAQHPQEFVDEAAEIRDEWVRHLANFEVKVEAAVREHEYVRKDYGLMFEYYIADNPGRDREDLKDDHGAHYVQYLGEHIKLLRDAENDLETARAAAREAGVDPNAEHAQDLGGYDNVPNEWVEREAEKLIAEVDRGKISRWVDFLKEFGPWSPRFPDFDSFSEIEGRSEDCQSRVRGSCTVGRKGRDKGPSRGFADPFSHRLRTSDVGLDTVSRFDDYDYRRRHIDAWATRMRGGYL